MTPLLWQSLVDYLVPIALGGASAFLAFVALLPTKIGERLIGEAFERRMVEFKHQQSIELGKLQESVDNLKDRGQRSNKLEYDALQQAWERFVEAYRGARSAVIQFYRYPDLDRMPEDDILAFLEANNVPETSKAYVMRAEDKKRAFSNYLRNKSINEAHFTIEAARDYIAKQSVFIPANLHILFEKATETLRTAIIEQDLKLELTPTEQASSRWLIDATGEQMFNELRDAVRNRLLREG